jgi:threonine/homoserine/homoserine lactone efflux protein
MIDIFKLQLFFVAAIVLLVTPGPAVLYIVARSVEQGRLAGIVSTLGIATGTLFHVAAAALGVSVILVTSALAFTVLKFVGAAYLIYLGVRRILSPSEVKSVAPDRRLSHIFYQGMVVNILNPKTALFFFAFLPQFVDVSRGGVAVQMLVLGLLFVGMGMISDGAWALLAGTVGNWAKRSNRVLRFQRFVTGGILIALGVATALYSSGKK